MSTRLHLFAGAVLAASLAIAAPAGARQSIALILDASGSMNARLPEGQTRIQAAKAAVADIVGKREDLLRRADGGWLIARRKILLDQNVLLSKNLTFFF